MAPSFSPPQIQTADLCFRHLGYSFSPLEKPFIKHDEDIEFREVKNLQGDPYISYISAEKHEKTHGFPEISPEIPPSHGAKLRFEAVPRGGNTPSAFRGNSGSLRPAGRVVSQQKRCYNYATYTLVI